MPSIKNGKIINRLFEYLDSISEIEYYKTKIHKLINLISNWTEFRLFYYLTNNFLVYSKFLDKIKCNDCRTFGRNSRSVT